MGDILGFEVKGLFGNRKITLRSVDNVLILVGPNGIGKSTVINAFYFFITRQWSRLLQYTFDEVAVFTAGGEIRASREEIFERQRLQMVLSDLHPGSRPARMVDRLSEFGLFEEFIKKRSISPMERKRYADALSTSTNEVISLHHYLGRRLIETDERQDRYVAKTQLEHSLLKLMPGRALYLPTYRRIEKDLKEIFPGLDEKFRGYVSSESGQKFFRSANHYVDLVSFGMEDVRENIARRTGGMRDYSLKQYNELSALYLRDVIRGKGDAFTAKDINQLTDDRITEILNRVSEHALPVEDKALLLRKVKAIQNKKKADIEVHDRFLAHYFTRLVAVSEEVAERERDIAAFVEVCNAYLNPGKRMIYDEIAFTVKIEDQEGTPIDLSALSSGEKQIVSLFSHLYLDELRHQIVVIDEPELSLSVLWQKRFLKDILDSGRISFLVAVTHSPFIYDNDLRKAAIDVRRATTIEGVPA